LTGTGTKAVRFSRNKPVRFDGFMPAIADAAGAKWNMLFPLDGTYTRKDLGGTVTFDKAWLGTMLKNWVDAGKPKLSTDYWHFGDSDPDVVQPFENKLASGDIVDVELRNDGLYGLIEWTDKARACILSRELKSISPTFFVNGVNRHTGEPQGPTLAGAALLNDPFLQEIPQVAASTNVSKEKLKMDHATACTIHGLNPDTTSPEQLKQHMAKCAEAYKASQAAPAEGAPPAAAMSATEKTALEDKVKLARDEATRLAAEKTELSKRVEKMETERHDEKVAALNKELLDGGYITAAQQEGVAKFAKAFGIEESRTHYTAGGKKVELGEKGNGGSAPAVTASTAHAKFSELMDEYQEKQKLSPDKALAKLKRDHPDVWKSAAAATPAHAPK
jgi:hypothetical protein